MRCLIAIDDTDNLESRGTGFRARQLGLRLAEAGFGRLRGVTRHQLYVHPSIPYTSHNSSACLDVDFRDDRFADARDFCRAYLAAESADGSDAGLCLAEFDSITEEVVEFGRSAKERILTRDGALAGVGLRRGGQDGRFIWLEGVRELSGSATTSELLATTGIDSVETTDGLPLPADAAVVVDPWPRPVLRDGRAVLLTERCNGNDGSSGWRILPKEVIRRY